MICRNCAKEVTLEGIECPLCGVINPPAEVKLAKPTSTKVEIAEVIKKKGKR